MGNAMGKKRKIGSSMASKRYGGPDVHAKKDALSPFGRSYSMPVHHAKPKTDNYHVVALTSSTYGILKVDATKDMDEARTPVGKSRLKEGSGIEGLEQLKDLDKGAGGISMKWSEVEEILNKMKPIKPGDKKKENEMDNKENKLVTVTEEVVGEPETINMWELMEGLDDDARSPLPFHQSTPLLLQQPVLPTPPKRGRGLETSLSFSAVHNVTEVDAPTLKAAIHAEAAVEKAWRPPQATENIVAGKIQAPILSSRLGSGKENAEPVKAYHRQASAAFALPPERPIPVGISSQGGVSAIVNALNNRGGTGAKQQPQPEIKKPVPTIWTQDANDVPVRLEQPSSGLEQQSSYTSPFSFQTSSSDESDDRLPPRSPLFDPEFLACFEKAMEEVSEDEWYNVRRSDADVASTSGSSSDVESPVRTSANGNHSTAVSVVETSPLVRNPESDANTRKKFSKIAPFEFQKKRAATVDPLCEFEKKCPPGGEDRIVLYFTSLRGIRKTFEDCSHLKIILQGFNVAIDERDVSIHAEFREELKELQGGKMVPVPRLYIKGHYIGGAEEVSSLHEDGTLTKLLDGLPHQTSWEQCDGCGGVRFVPCSECSGSRKIITEDDEVVRCTECNENGLMRCPICL